MRRNSVVKKILRKLNKFEGYGYSMDYNFANDLLKLVEECEPTLYNSWDWTTKKTKRKK